MIMDEVIEEELIMAHTIIGLKDASSNHIDFPQGEFTRQEKFLEDFCKKHGSVGFYDIRLPFNNRVAYICFNVINSQLCKSNNILNYLINTFEEGGFADFIGRKLVRPPTMRELLRYYTKCLQEELAAKDSKDDFNLDFFASQIGGVQEFISNLVSDGIVAVLERYGTWEENSSDVEYATFEELLRIAYDETSKQEVSNGIAS